MNMLADYQGDIAAWANQQAAFLRAGNLEALDLANLAEEIEGVRANEEHALMERMTVLWVSLLAWKAQPMRRNDSWKLSIEIQRDDVADRARTALTWKKLVCWPPMKPALMSTPSRKSARGP
jgi:hypothetical protein